MFAHFFIRRAVFASVCSLLIVLAGFVGYTRLPIQEYPNIDPPIVSVSTTFTGASPQVVETEVTEVLEAEINGIDGIKTLTSQSRESVSTITVLFEIGEDVDVGAEEVRSRVARAVENLPDEAEAPIVTKASGDASPILWFAIYGEKFSTLSLSDYADRFIVDRLETVPGVSSIIIGGERRYAMRLWLDPQRLAARNLTVLDVEAALQAENVEIPSGLIEGQTSEYSVRTLGRLQTPPEYEALVLRRNADGSQITLKDVGRAEIGAEDDRSFLRFKGQPGVGIGVVKLSNANTLDVARGVKERMASLAKDFPDGVSYQVAFDTSDFIQQAIDEVWKALYIAISLVILVIFFFLRDWRATLIPAVTIPVSLVGAFAVMFFLGFSINTLTLFALTLATGLVVDDTIVVLENIVRYIEEQDMDPFPASFKGIREVVFAVIATTAVLVAVFLPVGFTRGATGRLFVEFALTLAGSVVISSFVALTLAPALCARLLRQKAEGRGQKAEGRGQKAEGRGQKAEGRREREERQRSLGLRFLAAMFPFSIFERILTFVTRIYQASLERLMAFKLVVVAGLFVSFGVSIFLFQLLPREFLPAEDRGAILTFVRAPQGVTINYTSQVMSQLEQIYSQLPQVQTYVSLGAFSNAGPGRANEGIAFVRLKPWSERREPGESQQALIGQLFGQFATITDAFALPINPPSLPGVGFQQPIQFVLQGSNLKTLAETSQTLVNRARQLPQLINLDTNLKLNKPEIELRVDRQQAANLGISMRDISRTLQILLGGEKITSFNRGNRRYEVVVQAEDSFRADPEDIEELPVRTRDGSILPLGSIANLVTTTTPPEVNHFNRFRAATIEGSPAPGVSLGEALQAVEEVATEVLPPEIRTTLSGESLSLREAGQATQFIFGLALLFIFLVLAAQFESFIDPLVIMLAVPLSLLGAFGAMLFFGVSLNIYSQVGLIMLIGLVTKNSILIVEFANQLREQGLPIVKAAMESGRVRFRPILMTAFSTIFGLLPLAFANGAGAASRVSLGMAVLGGMAVSTVLSLYVVPVFYVIVAQAQVRLRGRRTVPHYE